MNPLRYMLGIVVLLLAPATALAEVSATEAWVRATVPAQKVTGAFMKLRSSESATLVSASSPAAKIVELHEMSMKNNVMEMRAVDALTLPPGTTVELRPGGYHVMMMDITKPLSKGEIVPIMLSIVGKDGRKSTLEVSAEVRELGGGKNKR